MAKLPRSAQRLLRQHDAQTTPDAAGQVSQHPPSIHYR